MRRKKDQTVRVSSKGQIVIPVSVRQAMGLSMGGQLRVRLESTRKLVLTVPEFDDSELREIFERSRSWTRNTGRDLIEELHERRRRERSLESKRRESRRR